MPSSDIHVTLSIGGWWFFGITCTIIALLVIGAVWITWFSDDKIENPNIYHVMSTGIIVLSGLTLALASWGLAPKAVTNVEDVRSTIQTAYGVTLTDESIQKIGAAKYSFTKSYGPVVDTHGVSHQFAVSNGTIFLSD